MKLMRNAFAAGLLVVATAVAACSGQTARTTGTTGGSNGGVGSTPGTNASGLGDVGVNLLIPNGTGQTLTSINWTISGGPGGTYTGTDPIGNAQSVEWETGGILAGCGYSLSVSGTDSSGDICTGSTSATFCVSAGLSTAVTLVITCEIPTDAALAGDVNSGSVVVDASVFVEGQAPYVCPGITSFSISPAEVQGTQTAAVAIGTTGTVSTISWTSTPCLAADGGSGGTIGGFLAPDGGSGATNPSATFSCGTCTGTTTVTAQIALDAVPLGQDASVNVCNGVQFTSFSGNINCEGGGTLICLGGQVNCSGVCTTFNSPTPSPTSTNCGGCGVTCTSPQVCLYNSSTGVDFCGTQPPTPCTSSPCASTGPNSVTCPGSTGGVCTATEANFVTIDINNTALAITGGSADSNSASCYECLLNGMCLDHPAAHVTGVECEDSFPSGVDFTNAAGTSVVSATACESTLQCQIPGGLGAGCGLNADGLSYCYCGTGGGAASACEGAAATAVNGPCLAQEIAGFNEDTSDPNKPVDIVQNYTDITQPSGRSNNIFGCALANSCTQCF